MNIICNPIMAAISGEQFFTLIIWLVILGVIYWLVEFVLGKVPVQEPVKTIIHVVLLIGIVILLINALLGLVGRSFITW